MKSDRELIGNSLLKYKCKGCQRNFYLYRIIFVRQPLAPILARLAMVQRRVDLAATKRLNYHCALRRAENGPDDRHREGEDRRGRAATGELHHWQLEARLRHYLEVEQGSREYIASSLDERSYVTLLNDRGKRRTTFPPSIYLFTPVQVCSSSTRDVSFLGII